MKKTWIIIGVIVLIVGFIGINIWKNTKTTYVKVETTTLEEVEMQDTVMTPGTLQLQKEQYIYNQPEKGEIAEILVKEGDQVEEGDELLRYENKQLALEKEQNELQLRSLYLEIDDIKKQHNKLDKELEKDKDNDMLQEEHDQIWLQQQMRNIDLEQALLQKETIEEELENLTIYAEVDGTILSVNEQAVSQGQMNEQSIIRIGSLNNLIVEGTISQYDTLKISDGQKVVLTSDAVPDEEWEGEVSFISDLPEDVGGIGGEGDSGVLYPVQVKLKDKINLKPGFKMLIEIVTEEEKVKTLPSNAVQQRDNENYVYIVEDGKAKEVEVKIGSVNTEYMEILEGVTEEDQVIINPSDDIATGTEVKVK